MAEHTPVVQYPQAIHAKEARNPPWIVAPKTQTLVARRKKETLGDEKTPIRTPNQTLKVNPKIRPGKEARRRRIYQLGREGGTPARLGGTGNRRAGGHLASLALLLLRGAPGDGVGGAARRGTPLLQAAVPAGAEKPRRSYMHNREEIPQKKRERKNLFPRPRGIEIAAAWR